MIPQSPRFEYLLGTLDRATTHSIAEVVEKGVEVVVANHENSMTWVLLVEATQVLINL